MSRALSIEVVSDVVCPWCFIGTRRLNQALSEMPDVSATVVFRPFLLDPSTPDEGGDLRERLRAKYGADPDKMFSRVEAAAHESGIPLDFSKVRRYASTVRAHTLLRHAQAKGTQRALKEALFSAYFMEGRDIGAEAELVSVAQAHGFAADEARALVTDPEELKTTRAEAHAWAEQGVTGVPLTILGERFAVPGAQAVDVFKQAIEKSLG